MRKNDALHIGFDGQLVLVTGGTRGIGKAIAETAAAAGADVVITGTGKEAPVWTHESEIEYAELDFTGFEWHAAAEQLVGRIGTVQVLINNAGINVIQDIEKVDPAVLRRVLEVNLVGPTVLTSLVVPSMRQAGYGRIVNVSSIYGIGAAAGRSNYSSSKAGLIGHTRAVALDLAPDNILVNVVAPGFVETDLTRRVLGVEGMQRMTNSVPLGRMAQPSEIAIPVLFLASSHNTFITGTVVPVDGGYLVG